MFWLICLSCHIVKAMLEHIWKKREINYVLPTARKNASNIACERSNIAHTNLCKRIGVWPDPSVGSRDILQNALYSHIPRTFS